MEHHTRRARAGTDNAHEQSSEVITVMLVDDHAFMRQATELWLQRDSDICVTAQAGSLSEAREVLKDESLAVDLAIVDLDLPDGLGTELISEMQDTNPPTPVLILTAYSDSTVLARAIEAGAAGIVHKSSSMADIVSKIKRLNAGEQLLSHREIIEAVQLIRHREIEEREVRAKLDKLTPREREVLQALAGGLGDKEIAQRLYITPGTVRAHMVSILSKLEARSRLQALVLAVHHGVVEVS